MTIPLVQKHDLQIADAYTNFYGYEQTQKLIAGKETENINTDFSFRSSDGDEDQAGVMFMMFLLMQLMTKVLK